MNPKTRGAFAGDQAGRHGILVLPDGNYLVVSPQADTAMAVDAGRSPSAPAMPAAAVMSTMPFDFETETSYVLRAEVSDGALTFSRVFTLTVTDVSDTDGGQKKYPDRPPRQLLTASRQQAGCLERRQP